MSAPCYVEKQSSPKYGRMNNNSGAALVAGEFALIGKIPACANGAIASGAYGSFIFGSGVVIQADDFVTDEGTFGTVNAPAYWDPATKTFSDTSTATYYEVGQVDTILASGVVMIRLHDLAIYIAA